MNVIARRMLLVSSLPVALAVAFGAGRFSAQRALRAEVTEVQQLWTTEPKPTSLTASARSHPEIKQRTEREFEIPRRAFSEILKTNEWATSVRLVPAFQGGQMVGLKMLSVGADSIYHQVGLQNGDVIKRVNGLGFDSPERALDVYAKLQQASVLAVEVEREGAPVTVKLHVL
jgi:type II secretory pathway component PulC